MMRKKTAEQAKYSMSDVDLSTCTDGPNSSKGSRDRIEHEFRHRDSLSVEKMCHLRQRLINR